MEFYSLQEFYIHCKGITYLVMGGILVFLTLYWGFLTDREDD